MCDLGACIDAYWVQKKAMAPGCEPETCRKLFGVLREVSWGMSLCGAGGGGFMYVLLKEGMSRKEVRGMIEGDFPNVEVYDVEVDETGMVCYESPCS